MRRRWSRWEIEVVGLACVSSTIRPHSSRAGRGSYKLHAAGMPSVLLLVAGRLQTGTGAFFVSGGGFLCVLAEAV
jgi:hypothetical protein